MTGPTTSRQGEELSREEATVPPRGDASERITAWVLAGVGVSLTVVIAWWAARDPEVFVSRRLGITEGIWSMPLVWILAIAIAVIYVAYTAMMEPMVRRNFFRFSRLKILGIWAALVTGIVEEVVFRQLLMDWLAGSGVAVGWQVVLSALVFGLAHAAWVLLRGEWRIAIPVVLSTFALGAMLAGLYLAADRSTLPAILAHTLVNLGIEPWLILAVVSGGKWDRSSRTPS